MQEVLTISGGQVSLRTGTLYTALDRLLQQGLVRVHAEEVVGGRMRRSYALTQEGRDALAVESERLGRTVREAERRLAARTSSAARPERGFGPGTVTA